VRRLAETVAILRIGITGGRQTAISSLRSSATATIVRRRPSIVTPFDSGKQAGYCGASARIKFDDEQFAALFNELQARGDKTKLMQLFGH
jgi:hypothetical protein